MSENFTLGREYFTENAGLLRLYVHKKSGGRVICADNNDKSLVFCLGFDTPASDDTGIPHILEHCVLCGSKRFPIRDPFNMLCQNTSYTYLNAITFPHKTVFPAASLDKNALWLMARVYCDGVFDPLVYENKGIFLQEGGFFDGKRINGVVYSEMCGCYDDMRFAAERELIRPFMPFHAAGVPDEIPNADYNAMLDHHRRFYTGANCTAVIWGDMQKERYLDMLDEYFTLHRGKEHKKKYVFSKIHTQINIPYDTDMTVIPLFNTDTPIMSAAYEVMAGKIKRSLPHHDISFNNDGPISYLVFNGKKEQLYNAVKNIRITKDDIEALRFYNAAGDFGYKPAGLYHGLKLIFADGDLFAADTKSIFDTLQKSVDIENLKKNIFTDNGITGRYEKQKKELKTYPVTDPSPLIRYHEMKDADLNANLPLFKDAPAPKVVINGKTAFVPSENTDIIYLCLAFALDIPENILKQSGILLALKNTSPFDISFDIADTGKPCFTLTAGFFAKDAEKAAREISAVFRAKCGTYPDITKKSPETLTKLYALGVLDKNTHILNAARGMDFDPSAADIAAVQKALFIQENLYCAVCCHESNLNKALGIASSLPLPCGTPVKPVLPVLDKTRIVITDSKVNTLSLAAVPTGSPAAVFAVCEILKNTYLWENVRSAGAYGCSCDISTGGNICITSFKDPNFEHTHEIMKKSAEYIKKINGADMHRFKIMCLNAYDRPKSMAAHCTHALKVMFGQRDIREDILRLTPDDLHKFDFNKTAFAAFKARDAF